MTHGSYIHLIATM